METSRDRVLTAINHVQPATVPVNIIGFDPLARWLTRLGAADLFELREKLGLDVQFARPIYTGAGADRGLDIWGQNTVVMGAAGAGYSADRGSYPLASAATVADVDRFPWPDPDDFDYQVVVDILRTIPDTARVVRLNYADRQAGQTRIGASRSRGTWIPLLDSVFNLVGMEETLLRLYTEPKLIEAIISRVEAFILGFERRLLDATRGLVDIFMFEDDFASQAGMLLSPEHWRRFLKPSYARFYGMAKSYNLKVWTHSCGTFREVLPDMVDLGMDVWEPVQVHLPGNSPEELKREYGGNLTFSGAVNTQRTLPYGTPEDVRAEVFERIRVLGKGGGYICGPDHTVLGDVPIENVLALLSAAREASP